MTDEATRDDGGAAFPNGPYVHETYPPAMNVKVPGHPGMSLRDYFAAAALTGLLAGTWSQPEERGLRENSVALAECAYVAADALLRARSATRGEDDGEI